MRDRPIVLAVGPACADFDTDILSDHLSEDTPYEVRRVDSQAAAVRIMLLHAPTVILIDMELRRGSPIAVADFAAFRHPDARVILFGGGRMVADGSLFAHMSNATAHVGPGMAEPDVRALVGYHAAAATRERAG
jgi:hypothetical protein